MNTYRKPLDYNSLPAIIQEMIEENSKTAAIIDELIQSKGENDALAILIILDDMNIRGVQISTLYKMCNQSIDKMYEKITNITKEDIDDLNFSTFAICKHKALFEGTKKDREQMPDKYIFTDEERNTMRNKKSKDRVQGMLEERSNKSREYEDLYPSITSSEALSIIDRQGFICGYKKKYKNKDGKNIIYRVFTNEIGDILYTHSLEDPDIFLWGDSKLNAIRQVNHHKQQQDLKCNTYHNVKGITGYNIELREKPFTTYKKVPNINDKPINGIKPEYYGSNLLPIIESEKAAIYKEDNKDYKDCVIASIYSLLTFKETYYDLDDNLKKIYKTLLSCAEDKAYDEIIYQLSTDEGIDIAKKLQDVLGIKLNKEKLLEAKERLNKDKHFEILKPGFLKRKIVDEKMAERITKIVHNNRIEIK